MSATSDAINLLKSFTSISKAESAGRITLPSEIQAKREYGQSFARFPRGISGGPTPDLPERGKDWHGTVPGVPDEPQDDGEQKKDEEAFKDPENLLNGKEKKQGPPEPANLMATTQEIQDQTTNKQQPPAPPIAAKSISGMINRLNNLAFKSLAAAPRFSLGPVMPPKERSFLIEQGFEPDDVDSGTVSMTPRMRAQFNRDLLSAVQKSINRLAQKIESK